MSLEDIRQSRGVPARRNMRVIYRGSGDKQPRYGTIIEGSGGYIRIRLDGDKFARVYHPTWMLDYLNEDGTVIFKGSDN